MTKLTLILRDSSGTEGSGELGFEDFVGFFPGDFGGDGEVGAETGEREGLVDCGSGGQVGKPAYGCFGRSGEEES